MARKLNLIVAACNNMGIGIDGRLPWRFKQDMAFFKKVTTTTEDNSKKNMVVMGKRTWFSIPPKFRPLPDRINVVLSTQLQEAPDGAHLASSLSQAVSLSETLNADQIFIIGGASVYKEAMESDFPCRIYLTRIFHDYHCDTFLPDIDLKRFTKISDRLNVPVEEYEENGIKFCIEVFDKNV
uniref:dihydrofolate reductase n=1 Tax=Biomphalaria glabrata TaxID=6526 RepID=A0A2C9K691_BIOGL